MSANSPRVLAIGIDAAEPTLVQRMIDEKEMPALKSLLSQGRWLRVQSPSNIGSGSVWPTMIAGEDPSKHGVYGEWCWQPETMNLKRYSGTGLIPFWRKVVDAGIDVGILDVPFARPIGMTSGFEITEWGPHDLLEGRMNVNPNSVNQIIEKHPAHPFAKTRLDAAGPHDYSRLTSLGSESIRGIQLRGRLAQDLLREVNPQLSLIVFSEIHHSSHYLWHKLDPENPIYKHNGFYSLQSTNPTVKDIYCAVDREIGDLVKQMRSEDHVIVFSLHGMRATHGIPAFLAPLLCEAGFAKLAGRQTKSWGDHARTLLAAGKLHTPAAVKKLYYRSVSANTAHRMAQTTMLPAYDWRQTRAFSLPTDQHGWIRINLKERELRGCVPFAEYEGLCEELEQLLVNSRTVNGDRLVRRVIRTAESADAARKLRLPDLIVHWDEAAFVSRMRVDGFEFEADSIGGKFTGQHALDGFAIFRGAQDAISGDVLRAAEIGKLLSRFVQA